VLKFRQLLRITSICNLWWGLFTVSIIAPANNKNLLIKENLHFSNQTGTLVCLAMIAIGVDL